MDINIILAAASLLLFVALLAYFGFVAYHQQQIEPDKPPPGFIPQQAFDARLAKAEEKFNERYSSLEGQLQPRFSTRQRAGVDSVL